LERKVTGVKEEWRARHQITRVIKKGETGVQGRKSRVLGKKRKRGGGRAWGKGYGGGGGGGGRGLVVLQLTILCEPDITRRWGQEKKRSGWKLV